ncbi:MAG TPA: hypothetical protein VEK57_15575 [Thermoanaerobaculia bacterium]|nr:hypothetical protein [Thermoanaerobaculia bacterium]
MKPFALGVACFALLACASSGDSAGGAKLLQADLQFVQLVGPEEMNWPAGSIEVQYGMRIANKSGEPITLRQVEVESLGQGGPYRLRRDRYFMNVAIPPASNRDATFWARAYAEGDSMADDANMPVTVRGVAFFESPAGNFRKVFVQRIVQSGALE